MQDVIKRLRPPQAAEYLGGLSTSTLAKWRVSGFGPRYLRVGARIVYEQADLDEWLISRRRRHTADLANG